MANDFRSFSLQLDDFAKKIKLAPTMVVKRCAFDLFSRIIKRTPVDTGRARASWTIAANRADRAVQPQGVASYPVPATPLSLTIQPGESIWISNNLPYITALEDGHSTQAPAGMVAVSLVEVDTNMRRLEREGLKDAGL